MRNKRTHLYSRAICLATIAALAPVMPAIAAEETGAATTGGLEEIVVTAQRRSENLQEVPISVTAVSESMLTSAGIQGTAGLQQLTPGLVTYQVAAAFLPYIRGIGSSLSQNGFDSSIAIYIDGIYQANKASNIFDLNSIERIEVLKGPQGTLFGRNATGGAINVITKDPGQRAEFRIEAGYGRFDERRLRAYASAPITETLGANVGIALRKDDGYVKDRALGRNIAITDRFALSAKMRWSPSDRFDARLSFLYNDDSDNSSLSVHVLPGTLSTAASRGIPTTSNNYESRLSGVPTITNKSHGITLNMRYDAGFADLVSISGYRKGRALSFSDGDLSPANLAYSAAPQSGRQASQELQLVSNKGGPLQWITGLYYIWDNQGYANNANQRGLNSASNVPPPPVTPADLLVPGASVVGFTTRATTRSKAAFAQASYHLTDADQITVGLRYSHESKALKGIQYRRTGVAGVGGAPASFLDTQLAAVDTSKSFSRVTWRAAYDHQFNDDLMGYISYNRGFKSGGFNPTVVNANPPAVDPETLDAYEIGLKSEFFDRRLRFNIAAFYYDYRDIQVQLISAANSLTTTENAGAAETYGLDIDLEAVPSDVLKIRAGLNLLHSKYTKYPAASVFVPRVVAGTSTPTGGNVQVGLNAKGFDTVFAPKITANIGFDYDIPVGNSRITLSGSAYYNDGYDVSPGGINAHVEAFETVNGSITYYGPDDRYFVRLWGENLTKDVHPIYLSPQSLAYQVANNRPISYGVTVGFSLN
ncbi:TonB-dependent receptor [Rhizorhabdus dicambivorans]|uniref:TonB-dependent receptor n=1 Tax=Rhizorhabdus dicambivorans TaxID=1850238 RepID=UPI00082BAAB2|nr:TonB-dependent receptor [Rhizorhabdus dicambivorans]ATE66406.1 TonB-dependent receptor [Rhizorhabdus dicambivorans]